MFLHHSVSCISDGSMRRPQSHRLLSGWPAPSEPQSLRGYICWLLEQKTERFYSLISLGPAYLRPQYTTSGLWVVCLPFSQFGPNSGATVLPGKDFWVQRWGPKPCVCLSGKDVWRQAPPAPLVLSMPVSFILVGLPDAYCRLCPFPSCLMLNLAPSSASPELLLGPTDILILWPALPGAHHLDVYVKDSWGYDVTYSLCVWFSLVLLVTEGLLVREP